LHRLTPSTIVAPFARCSHGGELLPNSRIVETSGQPGQRPDRTIPATAAAQADQCFASIAAILAEAGMGPGHICHISAWLTGRANLGAFMESRGAFLSETGISPASTLLLVEVFPARVQGRGRGDGVCAVRLRACACYKPIPMSGATEMRLLAKRCICPALRRQ